MSSKLAGQLPLLMVHRKVAALPAVIPVIVVVGLPALVIVAVPDCTVHSPVPTAGVLAAIVKVLVLHWSIFTPASAVVGVALLVKVTSSKLGVHTPFEIVHLNVTLNPAVRPVTVLTSLDGVVITAPFAAPMMVHKPEPTAATFPDKVNAPLLHCSWSAPAAATVGVA
jgi:hypothetical protein